MVEKHESIHNIGERSKKESSDVLFFLCVLFDKLFHEVNAGLGIFFAIRARMCMSG